MAKDKTELYYDIRAKTNKGDAYKELLFSVSQNVTDYLKANLDKPDKVPSTIKKLISNNETRLDLFLDQASGRLMFPFENIVLSKSKTYTLEAEEFFDDYSEFKNTDFQMPMLSIQCVLLNSSNNPFFRYFLALFRDFLSVHAQAKLKRSLPYRLYAHDGAKAYEIAILDMSFSLSNNSDNMYNIQFGCAILDEIVSEENLLIDTLNSTSPIVSLGSVPEESTDEDSTKGDSSTITDIQGEIL